MAPKLRLAAARPTQLSQWERLEALRKEELFCDVALQSSEGQRFPAHAVVLAACSEKLRKLMEQAKVPEGNGQTAVKHAHREAAVGASSGAVAAVLDFVYSGQSQLALSVVPEVARLARRWDLHALQEALASSVAAEEGGLTPEVVAGLFALGEPFGEQLGAAARSYVLGHFASCAQTEPFLRWPQKVLEHILKSDQLTAASEEDVLMWVARWKAAKAGREDAACAILASVRWPLLSLATLEALEAVPANGAFSQTVAERCKGAKAAHQGLEPVHVRQGYSGWWAGLGCAAKGGAVIAGQGAPKAEVLKVQAVRPHEGTLLLLDASQEPGRVVQWFLRMGSGRCVAGKDSELQGANSFEEMADIWSGPDDAYYIVDRDAERVVQVRHGEAVEVSKGTIRLERPCAVAVEGPDRAVYVLDREGSRVVRFVRGRAMQVAGGTEPGSGPGHLNAGPTGRVFAAKGGRLYISDTGNHRVQRWDPGAKVGVTVAGGKGCGSGADQLSHPSGIWALDNGTLFVADTGNHRVMKWRDGAKAGVLAAGGYGPGDGLHQLKEPVDVTLDAGGLIVADFGNARVMRWSPPAAPGELLAAVKG